MKENKRAWAWIKAHKIELIEAGIKIGFLIATIIVVKKGDEIEGIIKQLIGRADAKPCLGQINRVSVSINNKMDISNSSTPDPVLRAINVDPHIRNLPAGCHASAEKIATALEHNFILKDDTQTWVKGYYKGGMAA